MKRRCLYFSVWLLLSAASVQAGMLDDFTKQLGFPTQQSVLDTPTIVSGLKEALTVGTEKAVSEVSVTNGYFGNSLIKILMPDKIKGVVNLLGKMGYQSQVDEFILSMNRAAEKAAPQARDYFVGALQEMTFDDARKILAGGDTAATQYFKAKTTGKLTTAFRPVVEKTTNEVGVTRQYKDLMGRASTIPFLKSETLDIDQYVVDKGLDGLFFVLGQEEKKIRTNPTARVTDLLKEVFGK